MAEQFELEELDGWWRDFEDYTDEEDSLDDLRLGDEITHSEYGKCTFRVWEDRDEGIAVIELADGTFEEVFIDVENLVEDRDE